ncbi:MAG: hypothetical protein U0521_19490 [Anaerolineae bacterium]
MTTSLHHFLYEIEKQNANRLYYLATAPNYYEAVVTNLRQMGMTSQEDAAGGAWWWRSRSAMTSARRGRSTVSFTRHLIMEPGLPHRPLSGQGNGSEYPVLPLRQHHLRADLEPELRRSRR